jgi:RHS repeat-associated protein
VAGGWTTPTSGYITCTSLPFGDALNCTNYVNTLHFTGKERDAESGNDDFGARYYSNRFGRWLSADWSNVPAPVPYANLSNPQTLNLYSMVSDDPESFADLDGHCNTDGGSSSSHADCPEMGPAAQILQDQTSNAEAANKTANQNGQAAEAQNNSTQQPALVPLSKDVNYTVANNGPNAPEVHAVFSPETADHLNAAFKELNKDGITPQINSAFRTDSDQAYMQSGGSGTNPAAKVSWHQAGAAVDINGTRSPQFKTIISVMKKNGFSWGGDYKSKKDPPHFDGRQFMGNLNQAVRKAQSYWDSTQ